MNQAKHNILDQKIAPLAAEFRSALDYGEITEAVVDRFVNALAGLPAGLVSQVDVWLPWRAGLHRRPGVAILVRSRALPSSDGKLLQQIPRIAWLFMFHRDGCVRQAALESLPEPPPSGFFVAALALRMNDWVDPVALAATLRFKALILATPPEVIVASAPFLLDRWRYWGRWTEYSSGLLEAQFSRADVVSAFVRHLRDATSGPLGREMVNFLRRPALDPHLADFATQARNPVVRAIALKCQIEGRASWPCGVEDQWIDKVYGRSRRVLVFQHREIERGMPQAKAIRLGLQDRSVFVRRIAADALTERPDQFEDIGALVEAMSADRSPSIRERADYLVRHLAPA